MTRPAGTFHASLTIDTVLTASLRYRFSGDTTSRLLAKDLSNHEAHVSTQPSAPPPNPRLPRPDEHEERTARTGAPAREGPKTARRLLKASEACATTRRFADCSGGVSVRATLTAAERIRRRPEFNRVYEQGSRASGRYLSILVLRRSGGVSRVGIVATRRLGGATHRNRAKRLIRELFRLNKPIESLDLVVMPRPELLSVPFSKLEIDFRAAVAKPRRKSNGNTVASRTTRSGGH